MKKIFFITFVFFQVQSIAAQNFTRKDSLQGGFSRERMCYDILHYDLDITVDPTRKTIVGSNTISFKFLESSSKIQVDLFENMNIDSIVFQKQKLKFLREHHAVFISFPEIQPVDDQIKKIKFYYSGKPEIAKQAPWDGGFVFAKDKNKKPHIGVAVQGTGASLWYPVKDSQSDEPDHGANIKVAVPDGLMNVSNGKFIKKTNLRNGYNKWEWEVKNPINNYNITLNIGDYEQFSYQLDDFTISYYVLKGNKELAVKHFEEVKAMMQCFQDKFGPYPFKEDGYKLVETPYLGMEHQSAIAYGNKFLKGYMGSDPSGTGIGLLFDYITIHESAHEWFGNNITSKDIADMWIHEAFTTYAESVFIECEWGYEKAISYINGNKKNVGNIKPIRGFSGVNYKGDVDMYYKGSLMLNTIRHIVNNDTKWWEIIKKFSTTFSKQIIEYNDVVAFFNKETNLFLTPIFNQYLMRNQIPILELRKTKKMIQARWKVDEIDFEMPIEFNYNNQNFRKEVTKHWTPIIIDKIESSELKFNNQKFYYKIEN